MATQTATILVSDLVGSTELRAALGEERAEEVRRLHDRALVDAAERNGGTVVKGLGDGVLVRFAGAAEAVATGVAMQQAVEALARREGLELAIRVGLSAGDVTLEDGDCFGTPVVEASRLCAAAGDGEIHAADVVTVLARGRGGHAIEPVGELDLKGLPDPVPVHRILWEPVRRVADLRAPAPYVGREDERRVLRERFASAAEGRGGLVLISGEPGIGKTRLVTELCHEVSEDPDALVLVGGCHDGEVVAWAPFVEALTRWLGQAPAAEVRDVLGPDAPVLQRVVPGVASVLDDVGSPPELPPDEAEHRLHLAVARVLGRLAVRAPVVLVLDDLHWADAATVGLLRAVARHATDAALLVVGTYRDTDLDRRHPLAEALPVLRREVEPTRLSLDGLSTDAVHQLLVRLADHEVPEAFADLLTRQTAGNPFFLREMLLHLVEEGSLRFEDGAWVAAADLSTAIPEGIREVIGRRVSQLSEAAQALLAVAALFEVDFPLPVVADVAGLAEEAALDAVDEALAAQVVVATERFDHYAFTHALFRQTLAGEQNLSRQVRAHRAIAEALEKRIRGEPSPAEAATLVRHWHQSAAMPGADRGVPAALVVAADARARYANREAFDALTVALELLPDGDERISEVRWRRGEAGVHAGIAPDLVADDLRVAAEVCLRRSGSDAAVAMVGDLLREIFGFREHTWAIAAIARPWLAEGRRDITWARVRQAELEEAEYHDPDNPGLPLDVEARRELLSVVEALRREGEDTTGLLAQFSSREAALEEIRRLGRPASMFAGWFAGETAYTLASARQMIIDTAGDPAAQVVAHALMARTLATLGDHAGADQALEVAFQGVDQLPGSSNSVFQVFAAQALVGYVRGRHASDVELSQLDAMGQNPDTHWASLAVVASTAPTAARAGDEDRALELVDRAMVGVERAPGYSPNYPLIVCFCAEALWILGRRHRLDALEENLRTKVIEPDIRYPEALPRLALARLCALDGRIEEAREWVAACHTVVEEQATPALGVHVDHFEAELELRLGADGDRERFRAAIARARAGCEDPAMAPWLDRLDALEAQAPW